MADDAETTTAAPEWTLWVFAGPGALSGLYEDGGRLGLAETRAGEHVPIIATLQRALGGERRPTGVRIILETVGEPTLLQKLTREWPTQRMIIQPGQIVAEAKSEPGQRDLEGFIRWAMSNTPPGSRRALVLLGDVLRAIGDEPPEGVALGLYRPTYPKKVIITMPDYTTVTWDWVSGSGWATSGRTSISPTSGQTWANIITEGTPTVLECHVAGDPLAPQCS